MTGPGPRQGDRMRRRMLWRPLAGRCWRWGMRRGARRAPCAGPRAAIRTRMDPHSQNVGTVTMVLQQIYDPLISRNAGPRPAPRAWRLPGPGGADPLALHPAPGREASTRARPSPPRTWSSPSRARCSRPRNYGIYVDTVDRVEEVDDFTVDIITEGRRPDPAEQAGQRSTSCRRPGRSGTTPPARRTPARGRRCTPSATPTAPAPSAWRRASPTCAPCWRATTAWWGWSERPATPATSPRSVFRPIASDATRVAALLSGEVDFVLDPPLQDLTRLRNAQGIRVLEGPEVRTIFLAMDVNRDELLYSDVQRPQPVQGPPGAPGAVPGDRHPGDPPHHHARPVACRPAPSSPSRSTATSRRGGCAPALRRRPAPATLLAEAGYPERLRRHARLPEQPLHQRRADLPGDRRDVGARRRPDQREGAAAGALLRQDPARRHQRLPAGLGRADLGCALFLPVAAGRRATARRATASGTTAATPTRGWMR